MNGQFELCGRVLKPRAQAVLEGQLSEEQVGVEEEGSQENFDGSESVEGVFLSQKTRDREKPPAERERESPKLGTWEPLRGFLSLNLIRH